MQPTYDDIKVCIIVVKCKQSLKELYQKNNHIMTDKGGNFPISIISVL